MTPKTHRMKREQTNLASPPLFLVMIQKLMRAINRMTTSHPTLMRMIMKECTPLKVNKILDRSVVFLLLFVVDASADLVGRCASLILRNLRSHGLRFYVRFSSNLDLMPRDLELVGNF